MGDTQEDDCSLGAFEGFHSSLHEGSRVQGKLGYDNDEDNGISNTWNISSYASRLCQFYPTRNIALGSPT